LAKSSGLAVVGLVSLTMHSIDLLTGFFLT
jgi:hypothetical protein